MALIPEYRSLPNTTLAAYFVGAYVLYRIIFSIYLIFFHPLAKFPGPKTWAVSRIPWARRVIKGDIWQVLDQLHLQYGPVVRIAPDEITTISPDAWKDLYVTRPLLPKDPYSQTPPLNGAHSLFTAADDTHKRIRGAIVNAFSDKALRNQSPIIEHHATRLIERIHREKVKSPNGIINLQKLFGYATFDTITDLSFGESFDGLEGDKTGQENSMIQNFFFHAKFSTIRNCLTRFAPLDIFLGLFLLGKTRASRTRNWKNAVDKIERRLAKGDVRDDFLTPVVGRIDETGRKGITSKELTTNGLAFVIADCQLSTVALATATYFLLREPKQWKRLAEEVRGRFVKGEEITVQSTQGMVYLEAVINETLRIRHPTPISLPRVLPKEGRVVGGVFVPGNTVVGINLQNIQTSPTLWVEPEVFHPERFLPKTDERYEERFEGDVKEAFMPFSTGVRNCIGSKVFLAQARVFLARLVWTFDLEMQGGQEDWLDQKAFLVFEPKPLFVKPTSR
ncbi:benzoate 4-monooxygenase cytochrome P450 [Apiosordaria backusii]|uniref:Benzoate 4-monooxygenase cytochrome P450 n=1 Tax=Apiosordaria backusii TaxID=314023 RepID=A0AA40DV18_9PEZI|nr:benzoate 4-monooxygenase cytochrome P450 [Apiosordaria backusii]